MQEQHTIPDQTQPMSFTDKIVNIFASPGELFENVRQTGSTSTNWVLPWLIFAVVAIVTGQLIVNNPSLADQLATTIRQALDKSVQEGSVTRAQADQAFEFTRPGSTWFTVIQIASSVFGPLVALFVLGLLYWLIGKSAMNATAPFMKVVEVVGLTFFIGALEQIITTTLMFAMNSIYATPSLGIFVTDFDINNKLHVALSKVNIFTFWTLAVVSVGLSTLFRRDFPKVLVLVAAIWILWSIITLLTGVRFG